MRFLTASAAFAFCLSFVRLGAEGPDTLDP